MRNISAPPDEAIPCKYCGGKWLPLEIQEMTYLHANCYKHTGKSYLLCGNIKCLKEWNGEFLDLDIAVKKWNEANE